MGVDDVWGGFGFRYLERIRDEYGVKIVIWIWGLELLFKIMLWVCFYFFYFFYLCINFDRINVFFV